jgi:hypothetical protein
MKREVGGGTIHFHAFESARGPIRRGHHDRIESQLPQLLLFLRQGNEVDASPARGLAEHHVSRDRLVNNLRFRKEIRERKEVEKANEIDLERRTPVFGPGENIADKRDPRSDLSIFQRFGVQPVHDGQIAFESRRNRRGAGGIQVVQFDGIKKRRFIAREPGQVEAQ